MIFFKIFYRLNTIIRVFLYRLIYGNKLEVGKNLSFRKGFSLILDGPEAHVSIGNHCFFNNFCTIAARTKIKIGDYSIFGENIKIYDHNHIYEDHKTPIKDQGYTAESIVIGKHCWIASNVIILKGVTIGDCCVIGAGCIVHKDVPNNTVMLCKQQQILKYN